MRHFRSFVLLLLVFGVIFSVVKAAEAPGYFYKINNFWYTVGGGTYYPFPANGYATSKTFSGIPAQTPTAPLIDFQKLILHSKGYLPGECPLFKFRDIKANCPYCDITGIDNIVPPFPGATANWNYKIVSKHKLVDTRATNSNGASPSAFYTEFDVVPSIADGKNHMKGGLFGCAPSPLEPPDDD